LDIVWDGIVRVDVLNGTDAEVRHELADEAKRYDWTRVMAILRNHPALVNITRPGGGSLFAPLHQAAHPSAAGEADPRHTPDHRGNRGWRSAETCSGFPANDRGSGVRLSDVPRGHVLSAALRHPANSVQRRGAPGKPLPPADDDVAKAASSMAPPPLAEGGWGKGVYLVSNSALPPSHTGRGRIARHCPRM
jgi:hypothetical protein